MIEGPLDIFQLFSTSIVTFHSSIFQITQKSQQRQISAWSHYELNKLLAQYTHPEHYPGLSHWGEDSPETPRPRLINFTNRTQS